MEDIYDDDGYYTRARINEVRDASNEGFEKMMDAAHEEQMQLFEIESALKGGATFRAALYPLYNEITDLLQQLNSVEAGKNAEKLLKDMIDSLHKDIAEKSAGRTRTSLTTSQVAHNSASEKWKEAMDINHG